MPKKLAIIHTSFVSVEDLKALCNKHMPELEIMNIVDDSLLKEVVANSGLTRNVIRRICSYALQAETAGADAILNQCSSVGEAVNVARNLLRIPYLKVDQPMACEAVRLGRRITVAATVETTLGPSCRLVEEMAAKAGKKVEVKPFLIEGAFEVLMTQGREKHTEMVVDKVLAEAESTDVIVLAQGSMFYMLPQFKDAAAPVLASPESGILGVKEHLGI